MNELWKLGKNSASSWNKQEILDEINLRDEKRKELFIEAEKYFGSMNSQVHYNQWAQFTKGDFIPVIEVFQNFIENLECSNCKNYIEPNYKT